MSTLSEGVFTPVWKSIIPYSQSLILQNRLKDQTQKTKKAFILGFSCSKPVITLGLRGKVKEDLLKPPEECLKQGVDIISVKRGGQATIHAPGQLVIYPVVDLRSLKIKPRDFLRKLEAICIKAFKAYGLSLYKKEDSAGLFTNKGKIVFFGVHISGGVSQHGLSVNVQNNLKLFDLIKSCGLSQRPHDSFQKRKINTALNSLFFHWCAVAKKEF